MVRMASLFQGLKNFFNPGNVDPARLTQYILRMINRGRNSMLKHKLIQACAVTIALVADADAAATQPPARPNILWIVAEDHSPMLGCYGDTLARSPAIDSLAASGMVYERCWSNASICAPARTTLIAGMYAVSTGGTPMRSRVAFPEGLHLFPQTLRDAGYYCVNGGKEDYNIYAGIKGVPSEKPDSPWDATTPKNGGEWTLDGPHWRNRAEGQPFFAMANFMETHESRARGFTEPIRTDPAAVRVPAFYSDTPTVRKGLARYVDMIENVDRRVAWIIAQLEEDGLRDDTIIFYFADHGNGLPRSKRTACDSGLRVPLVVYVPEKWRHLCPEGWKTGGVNKRLVSFVDFAPTVLSLAGIKPPAYLQGHAFLGPYAEESDGMLFGYSHRADERADRSRVLCDGRYLYIRNFRPDTPQIKNVAYMMRTPLSANQRDLFLHQELPLPAALSWLPRPSEELYDLVSDPDEVNNLVADPAHAERLAQFRTSLRERLISLRDVELLPEADMRRRCGPAGKWISPYDMMRRPGAPHMDELFDAASLGSLIAPTAEENAAQLALLDSDDPAVRWWGTQSRLACGVTLTDTWQKRLTDAVENDDSPLVRITAAEALLRFSEPDDALRDRVLDTLVRLADPARTDESLLFISALQAIDRIGVDAAPVAEAVAAFPEDHKQLPNSEQFIYETRMPQIYDNLVNAIRNRFE